MAIIEPDGLFGGDRLACCSDTAQLYWPRLFLAANSCARLEMSYKSIISRVFANFQKVPESSEMWAIFREYEANFLAVLYEVDGGQWWCQFITSEKYLPKYKKTRDSLTPSPTYEQMQAHRAGYLQWKKSKSFQNQSFQKNSDDFQREGVGVGIGVGVGKKQKPLAKDKPSPDPRAASFRQSFGNYFQTLNNAPAPWDAKEATRLSKFLQANPTITPEQWTRILNNRRRSPVAHGKRLSVWIDTALSWLTGPADEWGKALNATGGLNGKGNSFGAHRSKTSGNFDEARAAISILAGEEPDSTGDSEAGECIEGHFSPVCE